MYIGYQDDAKHSANASNRLAKENPNILGFFLLAKTKGRLNFPEFFWRIRVVLAETDRGG